jgi:hypothetical protein
MDYRGLNAIARKDVYPLRYVDDTLDELKDANFCTDLDLASEFWQVRVREKDVHKKAIQTPCGSMDWVAMPLGLFNAPSTFHRMMNEILQDILHKLVKVYLDDVRIHCRTLGEHMEHLRLVL